MAAYAKLLGSPAIQAEQTWAEPAFLKSTALLLYLAYRGDWVSREELVYLLWPDTPNEKARRNLRQLLTKLRRLDYTGELETEETRLRWAVRTDIRDFNEAIAAQQWVKAVHLYQGKLLEGFVLHDAPEFETWLEFEREELQGAWREAMLAFATQLEADERHAQAAELYARLMKADPLDEVALRRYLQALALSGHRRDALQAYTAFEQVLRKEVDSEPEDLTQRLVKAIRQGESLNETETPSIATSAIPAPTEKARHNMPQPATPFVGRHAEKARIAERLHDPGCRLLTLVGAGGMGKTRLAIEAAHAQLDVFADGVWFVPLAALNSPELMVSTIAGVLDFAFFGSDEPKAQLLRYLKKKNLLLILDNFEQLLEGVGLLAEILMATADVKLLVTSRVRLNLQAEWVVDLEGLSFPKATATEDFRDFDAMRLFEQSAIKARADFVLDDTNVREVARICGLVEGMPLAIELASGWLRILSVAEVADEIERGLDLLEAPAQDVPARHRSVRAIFDYSWKLLSEGEQKGLTKLSVFHGGFTKDAALSIAGVSLPLLLAFSNKSFLRREASGRFTQHPLLWQYLREKASHDAAGFAQTQEKHARYFATFVHVREVLLQSLEAKLAQVEINDELANIREAWVWAIAHQRDDLLEQASEGLYVFYNTAGRFHEAEAFFRHAADVITREGHARGRILCFLGGCYNFLTNYERGIQVLQQSLAISRANGAKRDEALSLLLLSSCYSFSNRSLEEVVTIDHRCLQLFHETGDLAHEGETRGLLAEYIRDPVEAEQQFHESIRLFRESNRCFGMLGGMTLALSNFAEFLAHVQGAYQQAIDLLSEAIRIEQAQGETYRVVWYLNNQAEHLIYQGKYHEAEHSLTEARTVGETLESGWGKLELDRALYGLGWLAHLRGEPDEAKRYLTYVLNQIQSHGDAFGTGARAMDMLGCIALAEGKLDQALALCQEALNLLASLNPQRSGRDWAKVQCLSHLADVALAAKQTQDAQRYLEEALTIARAWHLLPVALHLCLGFAGLRRHRGEEQQATRLLQIASTHPASTYETRTLARNASHTSLEQFASDGFEQGKVLTLQEVLEEIQMD